MKRARDEMIAAQNRQLTVADRKRRASPYKVGDWVWVSVDDLMSPEERARPKKSLASLWDGPFQIVDIPKPVSVTLKLPPPYRNYPILHQSAVKPYHGDPARAFRQSPPEAVVDLEGHERYTVEKVLMRRKRNNKIE